jgi:MFS transporter, SP family, sugar:H+ symporter
MLTLSPIQWLFNWALAFATPYLVDYGPGNANLQSKIFFIWFGCCFLCITFVWFCIYETKGLSLEQVDDLYADVQGPFGAHRSKKWEPKESWEQRKSTAGQGGIRGDAEGLAGTEERKEEHSDHGSGEGAAHIDRV